MQWYRIITITGAICGIIALVADVAFGYIRDILVQVGWNNSTEFWIFWIYAITVYYGVLGLLWWIYTNKKKRASDPAPPVVDSAPNSTPPVVANTPSLVSSNRYYSRRTAQELCSELKGLPQIQYDSIKQKHIGHWIRIKGAVDDIRRNVDNDISVEIEIDSDASADCVFDNEEWGQHFTAMNLKETAIVDGRIDDISSYWVYLKDCELIPS